MTISGHHGRRLLLAVMAALAVAGCAGTTTTSAVPGHTVTSGPPAPPPRSASPKALTASQVTVALKRAGLPVAKITVYSAADDSNHLLGRPGEYTSKTEFTDARIHDQAANGVAAGGSVEVFPAAAEAITRARYIQKIVQAAPILGAEYDYVAGDVLLRVSGQLTPVQAAAYRSELAKITGAQVRLVP